MPECEYNFRKWAGKKIGNVYQGERLGGAILSTACGSEVYGAELAKGTCIHCGKPIKLVNCRMADLILR